MPLGAARDGALCSGTPGARYRDNMRKLRALLLLMALGPLPHAHGSTAADDVRAADAAFAARAIEVGQHAAFIDYLAEDAVLFRPEAVRGPEWLATHEPASGRLEWAPAAAAAGCNGRLAITTGPWRYSNSSGGEPVAGHYLSIWRRDAQSEWRVVLDHGTDHAEAVPAEQLQSAFARLWPHGGAGQCEGGDDVDALMGADERLNAQVASRGARAATGRAAGEGALAYRDAAAPGLLSALPADADAAFGPGSAARTVGSVFEPGADLAVTHGVLQSADGLQRALFVRVWARDRRKWRIVIDMRTPLPPD